MAYRQHVSFELTVETDVYADGDLLTDVAEIQHVIPAGYGPAIVTDVVVVDKGDQGEAFDIFFTRSSTSWGTVNSAVDIADAVAAEITGVISIAAGDYIDFTSNQVAFKDGLSVPIERANDSGSVYVATVSRGTGNYSATTDLTLELGITLY